MLDEDIETIVFQLHLPSDVMRALLDHHGVLGNLLLICKMMESHKWFDVNKLCQEYDWCVDQVINKYSSALSFSNGVFMSN
jgi:c-di-GMP-related signal transduction protein